ncbi:hypothetical protein HMPREF0322_04697 [Desulfitobacterium hafniense DP7]|uniref:Radical SAM domain protein n=1 Tax=Desulfitobacterium hafniense DP7 TaxID=537010 RepID=G9XUN8_DESHA|nr:radical SAM protein [Desulfitobacterium hafniense]EHL04610.1 hypothetical protein HMPREF0322_04697 [Desulfitobacterium hafniense DP7]
MASKFELERVSLILLMNCNLRCKKCCVQAPYYAKKYYPSLGFIKAEIDRLFGIADTINYFSVEGGEVFLRKDFAEVLAHLADYKEYIGVEAPVITNGTILPSREVLDAAKLFGGKIRFIIDDYGKLSNNVNRMVEILEQENIRYEVRNYDDNPYYGGWVDLYGDYDQKHDESGARDMYSRCAWAQKLKGVFEIIGGLIYFCPSSRVFYERGLAVAEDEVIDFMGDESSVDIIRDKIRALFAKESLAACKYCNGIHDASARYKPALQLTNDELKVAHLSNHLYRESL